MTRAALLGLLLAGCGPAGEVRPDMSRDAGADLRRLDDATSPDLASSPDLATVADMTALDDMTPPGDMDSPPPDLSERSDLRRLQPAPDLEPPPDLTPPADLTPAAELDLRRPTDLAAPPDLEPPPDLTPAVDQVAPAADLRPPMLTCPSGRADCNADPRDGCEVNLGNDPYNCGACGNACPTNPHAVPFCGPSGFGDFACSNHCDVNRGDCDRDPSNGCETDTTANGGGC